MRRIKEDTTLVGVSEFRTHAEEIVKTAQREPVIVEKRHKPMAVLLPIEQYERTEGLLDLVEDTILGLLAKERVRRARPKDYISLEELERRVGLRHS
ncbi:MAG: type II toxin-antitoxin system Phd/YefM family antitoxin [Candidatus Omnitrophica bacterium]|nr:type II toxin-antitoxin system Phd/YefM family antitoxin [Candidatus Omnitrophota bacterium]